MTKLPLYPTVPQAAAGWEDPLPIDHGCTRCDLGKGGIKTRCMNPEGRPGGLLLVAEMPGQAEDAVGRPFAGASGKYLRGLVAKHWHGPVALDNAVRCMPGRTETKEAFVDACRPYTTQVLEDVRPMRIVALGGWGAYAILGRKPPVLSVRRGFGWWIDDRLYPKPEAWVPVFFTVNPAAAMRNRFVARDFEADLEWALTCPVPAPKMMDATVSFVRTLDDVREAVRALRAGAWVAFDTETSGVMFDRDFRIETLTAYTGDELHGWAWDRDSLEDPDLREPLHALLADQGVRKVGHNLKYDALAVWCEPLLHVDLTPSMHGDTRLWRKLLEGDVAASLDVAAETVGMGGHKEEAQGQIAAIKKDLAKLAAEPHKPPTKTGKPRKAVVPAALAANNGGVAPDVPDQVLAKLWDERAEPIQYAYRYLDPAVRVRYNARDALSTALLALETEPRVMAAPNLVNIWQGVVKPAMRALTKIERVGIPADRGAIDMFEQYLDGKLQPVIARLQVYGKEINFNSPVQLRELLFDKIGLPRVRQTDSGLDSTGEDVLDHLKGQHPIIEDILEMRRLTTLQNRYARGMRKFVRDDGRIHTSFLLDGAGTGRMSSADPNLQNIPRPKDDKGNTEGKLARDIFVAPAGYVLLEADFSQLELRIAAMLSQDPKMIEFFASGVDFHRATARMISKIAWGIEQSRWDTMSEKDQDPYRSKAKTVNFGVHYGKTAEGLAYDLKCTVREADAVVQAILGEFKVLKRTMERTLETARRHGGVYAYWDGKPANWRPLPNLAAQGRENDGRRKNAENAAWNTPVQGTAAHYATASLGPIQDEFDGEGLDANVVLTVHDSILTLVHEDQVAEAAAIMGQVMTGHNSLGVPLVVDYKQGHSWGSLQKYTP